MAGEVLALLRDHPSGSAYRVCLATAGSLSPGPSTPLCSPRSGGLSCRAVALSAIAAPVRNLVTGRLPAQVCLTCRRPPEPARRGLPPQPLARRRPGFSCAYLGFCTADRRSLSPGAFASGAGSLQVFPDPVPAATIRQAPRLRHPEPNPLAHRHKPPRPHQCSWLSTSRRRYSSVGGRGAMITIRAHSRWMQTREDTARRLTSPPFVPASHATRVGRLRRVVTETCRRDARSPGLDTPKGVCTPGAHAAKQAMSRRRRSAPATRWQSRRLGQTAQADHAAQPDR